MTSATEGTASRREEGGGGEEEGEEGAPPPPPPRFPPPAAAASGKPLTPFSIADILGKPLPCSGEERGRGVGRARRGAPCSSSAPSAPAFAAFSSAGAPSSSPRSPGPSSPLCALEQLASKTFRALEGSPLLQAAANGRDHPLSALVPRPSAKKRRKSRTAFTNHQIFELEKRFVFQKYLSPADRDHLAAQLGLSNAQVITWFQNRRAKLKRDLEEMKADVESLKKLPPDALQRLARLPEEEESPAQGAHAGAGKGAGRGKDKDAHPDAPEPRPRDALSDGEDEDDDEEEEEEEEEEEIDVGD